MTTAVRTFLSGTIEGFYGKPWTFDERLELFAWMAQWGLNTYLYAPKDDLHHRAIWREPYSDSESTAIGELIAGAREQNVRFVFALSPGLDIRYGRVSEIERIAARFEQLLELRCEHFALLFDDIPDEFEPDAAGSSSLASAQSIVANTVFEWLRSRIPDARFLFCPTAYCSQMVERKLGGEEYLPTIGRELAPEIDVLWTGPHIVSHEISLEHVKAVAETLRRKPLIWDNLHANDYDPRRFFCGPFSGRPVELRDAVSGILSNPNNEFPLNYVPLRTLAAFCAGESAWDPRAAYLAAMREWLPAFETVRGSISFDDLVLFGDCWYLPHQKGREAEELTPQKAARLRALCARMTELRDRPLFHALVRRIWDLRQQLDRAGQE